MTLNDPVFFFFIVFFLVAKNDNKLLKYLLKDFQVRRRKPEENETIVSKDVSYGDTFRKSF